MSLWSDLTRPRWLVFDVGSMPVDPSLHSLSGSSILKQRLQTIFVFCGWILYRLSPDYELAMANIISSSSGSSSERRQHKWDNPYICNLWIFLGYFGVVQSGDRWHIFCKNEWRGCRPDGHSVESGSCCPFHFSVWSLLSVQNTDSG